MHFLKSLSTTSTPNKLSNSVKSLRARTFFMYKTDNCVWVLILKVREDQGFDIAAPEYKWWYEDLCSRIWMNKDGRRKRKVFEVIEIKNFVRMGTED